MTQDGRTTMRLHQALRKINVLQLIEIHIYK